MGSQLLTRDLREGTTFRERASILLESEELSDVTFLVGPKAIPIRAHRLILSISSSVFYTMFYGSLPEKSVVFIPDIHPEVFKDLLKYMYAGRIPCQNNDISQLLAAAHKYNVKHLEDMCVKYLIKKIAPDNACKYYEIAELYNKQNIMDKCVKIFENDTKLVIFSDSFKKAKPSTVLKILSLDKLCVNNELELFTAIEYYAGFTRKRRHQIDERVAPKRPRLTKTQAYSSEVTAAVRGFTKIPSFQEWQNEVRCLFQKVRFLTLTSKQFAEGPALSPILSAEEKLALMVNISSDKPVMPMPFGFSHSKIIRKKGLKPVSAIARNFASNKLNILL